VPGERSADRLAPTGRNGRASSPRPASRTPGCTRWVTRPPTIALDEGVALAVVQELLGHSDIRVTREYTHVSSPLVRDGAERVGRAVSGEK
jgi:integrase